MLSSNKRNWLGLGAIVTLIIWYFVFRPTLGLVWDLVSALLCVGIVLLLLPRIWSQFHGVFETASDLAAPIFVLVLACLIYSTAQMREVLWIKFASSIELDKQFAVFKLMPAIFTTDAWATVSIWLLIIALGVWGPAHFYQYSKVVEAFRLVPDTTKIADRLLQIMSDANRFGVAWLLAPLLPVIIFYNTIVPSFPQAGLVFYWSSAIVFYVLLLLSIFVIVYGYTLLVFATSKDSEEGIWRLKFVAKAFPYLH